MRSEGTKNFANSFETISDNFIAACVESKADVVIGTAVTISLALNTAEYLNLPVFNVKLAPDLPTRGECEACRLRKALSQPPCVAFAPPGSASSSIGIINLFKWYRHWCRIGLASTQTGIGDRENIYRVEKLQLPRLGGGRRLGKQNTW